MFEEAQLDTSVRPSAHFNIRLVAIVPRGGNVDGNLFIPGDFPDAAKRLDEKVALDFRLAPGVEVLVMAAAAAAKIRAGRLDAFFRGHEQPQRPRVPDAFGLARQFHLPALSGKRARDKNRATLVIA